MQYVPVFFLHKKRTEIQTGAAGDSDYYLKNAAEMQRSTTKILLFVGEKTTCRFVGHYSAFVKNIVCCNTRRAVL
jgi:hypothetical protein